ncbi:MAG TPA: NYN domain-containing protein [Vicinamibacterales bacterium]
MPDVPPGSPPDDPSEATLVFREQSDGRRVGRLPGGKVVLLDLNWLDRVRDGEQWRVRLRHKETFAIAHPLERVSSGGGTPLVPPAVLETRGSARADDRPDDTTGETPEPGNGADPTERAAPAPPAAPELPPVDAVEAPKAAPAPAVTPADILRPSDRVALFVDGANMDGAGRLAGYFLDYRKAQQYFTAGGTFYAAFYYTAVAAGQPDPLQQRFLDFLSHSGFIVRRKALKAIRDPDTGEQVIKGNLDVEIVLDMLNTAGNYDVAFLFSGDSDFERAVDLLRSQGRRVYIVSARSGISRELAYVADKPIFFLEDHRAALARDDRFPGVRNG